MVRTCNCNQPATRIPLEWVAPMTGRCERYVLSIAKDETLDNPASTKTHLHGPGRVSVLRWPDGGIDVRLINDTER